MIRLGCYDSMKWIVAIAVLAAVFALRANPYEGIAQRNAFALKPPAPDRSLPAGASVLTNASLMGIADFLKTKRALIVLHDPGKPPRTISLAEGEKDGEMELVAIDVVAGEIQLKTGDTLFSLSFREQDRKVKQDQAMIRKFVNDHTRAHTLHQEKEKERLERERRGIPAQAAASIR